MRQWQRVCGARNHRSELEADIYFAHPCHSWERGLNENRNGLLRQHMKLADVTEEQMQWTVYRLDHRPRKVLEYRTPHEVVSFGYP